MERPTKCQKSWWSLILSRTRTPCSFASTRTVGERTRTTLVGVLLLVLLPFCTAIIPVNAGANVIQVTNTTDPASTSGNGFCTLREAIDNANTPTDTTGGDCAVGNGTDTINFGSGVSGTITLGT